MPLRASGDEARGRRPGILILALLPVGLFLTLVGLFGCAWVSPAPVRLGPYTLVGPRVGQVFLAGDGSGSFWVHLVRPASSWPGRGTSPILPRSGGATYWVTRTASGSSLVLQGVGSGGWVSLFPSGRLLARWRGFMLLGP